MKNLILFFLMLGWGNISGQQIHLGLQANNTRALVIGISDYQDDRITDLKYSDKDAQAFAEFLISEEGFALSQNQVLLLTNEQATAAKFDAGLSWLIDETKEGDRVIIYFSGHGDVETKTRRQLGYLLCWDTPPQSYIMGAMPVYYFNAYIETLVLDNKAEVIVITDACRSGKLAGDEINGSQITNANLAKVYNNEIKILSCQPNEYSLEGEQWGGGRGAFSYFLLQGLYGMADQNTDLEITLSELDRYLEEKVTSGVAPEEQLPIVQGNRRKVLHQVNEESLQKFLENQKKQDPSIGFVATKGGELELLSELNSDLREIYQNFKIALDRKYFFQWSVVDKGNLNECADVLFTELVESADSEDFKKKLTRNYAVALQDDAQQFYNAIMKGDLSSVGTSNLIEDNERLQSFPLQLERAAELLGEDHYIFNNLKAKQEYFKAISAWLKMPFKQDKEMGAVILDHLRKSLEWQPEMAQAYSFIAYLYANNLNEPDSALLYVEKASKLSPSWILPYASVADAFLKNGEFSGATFLMDKAFKIDSNSVLVLNTRGKLFMESKDYDRAEKTFLRITKLEPEWSVPFKNLSYLYLIQGDFKNAESMADKAIGLNPQEIRAIQVKAWAFIYTDHMDEAEALLLHARDLDQRNIFKLDFDLACFYNLVNKKEKAFQYLETALSLGYSNFNRLQSDVDLSSLRDDEKRWSQLMKEYFPELFNN